MSKICFYSPYFPKHLGGGEKYFLDSASLAAENPDHQVFIAVNSSNFNQNKIKSEYQAQFAIDLSKIRFINTPLRTASNLFSKLWWTAKFDIVYYLTDGSLFFSLAKKNILHIQFPLKVDKSSFIEQLKLKNFQIKNTNSEFTKSIIEKSWPVKVDLVHHPMVNIPENTDVKNKEKIILSVGRFFKQLHSKRQDVLMEMFSKLNANGWKLVLLGKVEDQDYFENINKIAKKYKNIILETEADHQKLIKYYQKASIYWHAAGYDVDESEHPEKVEHFGISTVEAMSYGAVPIVINKGGQREIVDGELSKLLWNNQEECIDLTSNIIKNQELRIRYAKLAVERSKDFGKDRFRKKLELMLQN